MSLEKHFLHLKHPTLQNSREVQRAVDREERTSGVGIPNEPAERIESYLRRLEHLILDPQKEQRRIGTGSIEDAERPRALSLLREAVLKEYVRPNKDQMAQGAARVEQRVARQMGIQVDHTDEALEQRGERAIGDLESSLDQWITYLSDPNEPYPTWFRYYAFRNILQLGEYDKDKQEFPKRSKGTFKLFPDVDRGALAYVEEIMSAAQDDVVLERLREAQKELGTPEADMLTSEKAEAFAVLPFAKQYAEGIKTQGEITSELRAETRGRWIRYHQGDDPKELWKSLQNKGTAWCTRGYSTAKTQLADGDFYVYYTLDATGEPAIPRIAIRMEGQDRIAEPPRGVFDSQQNLEPNMVDILDEKLKDFGQEADAYRKKSEDMRYVAALEHKQANGEPFSKDDLAFLYEVHATIESFGYEKDLRVAELRRDRNVEEDMLTVFGCTQGQIARTPGEIGEDTRAYVGQLEPGFFRNLPDTVEYIYTSFPERRVRREDITVGGKSATQLISELEAAGINVTGAARGVLGNKSEFIPATYTADVTLVYLSVEDLGFESAAVINDILERAQQLGLELCPPDTGPHWRLQYRAQPHREEVIVGMKTIADDKGHQSMFRLAHGSGGLWLNTAWMIEFVRWGGSGKEKFAFRLPRS